MHPAIRHFLAHVGKASLEEVTPEDLAAGLEASDGRIRAGAKIAPREVTREAARAAVRADVVEVVRSTPRALGRPNRGV